MKSFEEVNRNNPKGKYGVHHYKMEDFGIAPEYFQNYSNEYQDFQRAIEKQI